MGKFFKAVFWFVLMLIVGINLNSRHGKVPPLAKFLNPYQGFWQNSGSTPGSNQIEIALSGLTSEKVTVFYDDRSIPHIFAANDEDLYFAQGYVTAKDRLWQMEFQTLAAAGRISEIIGSEALVFDRMQRRIGLGYAAEASFEALKDNHEARMAVESYANGVNAFIKSLKYKNLPVEYKLLNYEPEEWTPIKSALFLKYMANMLTGRDYDIENTNLLAMLGRETFDYLFPEHDFNFSPVIEDKRQKEKIENKQSEAVSLSFGKPLLDIFPEPMNGSNNWAVGPSKTTGGNSILCNDPHLRLILPAIWYEIQLVSPNVNVYGASLPGSPVVIIGHNNKIAWGVTNGSQDVRDWYKVEFKTEQKKEYKFDNRWLPVDLRIEEIKVRDKETVYDSVRYTLHGPVVYSDSLAKDDNLRSLALRWMAHEPSSELLTFFHLNRASNYQDYREALKWFVCPAQNFVFADVAGDIAIQQQGKFVNKPFEHGRFVLDGTTSSTLWSDFIPFEDNPHSKNPDRKFVSSANQHPTDSTYPYYYTGIFEYYRNVRVNSLLDSMTNINPEKMRLMQGDNYNLFASQALPVMMSKLRVPENNRANEAVRLLSDWNFFNNPESRGASLFEAWWDTLNILLWDEFRNEEKLLITPDLPATVRFIKEQENHPLADIISTREKETVSDVVTIAFENALARLAEIWPDEIMPRWFEYKKTRLAHIARIAPFSTDIIPIGGNKHIINATNGTHGASWRMVIELSRPPKAWGVYPGGQSGNPGDERYTQFADTWAKGELYEFQFYQTPEEAASKAAFAITLKQAKR